MTNKIASVILGFVFSMSACVVFEKQIPAVAPSQQAHIEVSAAPSATPTQIPNSVSSTPSQTPLQTASPIPTVTPTVAEPTTSPVVISLPAGTRIGITYSLPHANWLFGGYSAAKSGLQQIANLGVKHYRLEAYWNWLQDDGPNILKTDYNLEWQLAITNAVSADTVIMCVGRKVPHWPEFHVPDWAKTLSEDQQKQVLIDYISKLVSFYANDRRITHWQLENEVFFNFGSGTQYSDQENFLKLEAATIRQYDTLQRPIIITESGDKGNWTHAASFGDILGVSFYGISHENGQYVTHNNGMPTDWMNRASGIGKPVWLTELQAEPWGPKDNKSLTYAESLKSMDPSRFKEHLEFVADASFKDIYLWGAEWWIWMRDQGHPEMWEMFKLLV